MIIDIRAIYDLISQVGQQIYLCELNQTAGNPVYGIPKTQEIVKKQQIKGYLAAKSSYQIALKAGENKKKEYSAYIPAAEFANIKSNNFLEFENKFYQIEQSEPIVHEGNTIVYCLTLTAKRQESILAVTPENPKFHFDN